MAVAVLALIIVLALLIPLVAIVVDSPIGRALAQRLERPAPPSPDVAELAKKISLLEAEIDDLTRTVRSLQDDTAFLRQLLERGPVRSTLPPPSRP